jgi:DNA invertase Pin-like site-specific DNA recombinase
VLVGYTRVSTAEQSLALQRDALLAAGVEAERIYEDTCSGAVADRPGLARALDVVRAGDALVVWKLDRIGRSLAHMVELVGSLQAHGIGLKVLTGGVDTTTATGRLVFGIFAILAEFEKDLLHERTMAGLAAARARCRTGGRPPLMTRAKLRTAMAMMADQANAASDVAEQLGISTSTLYAYVDGKGQPKPRTRKLLGSRGTAKR